MESSLIFASVGWWWLNSNFFSRPSNVGAHVLHRLFIPASGGRGYAHTSPDSPSSAPPWPPLSSSLDPAGEAWLFLPFLPLWLRGRRGGEANHAVPVGRRRPSTAAPPPSPPVLIRSLPARTTINQYCRHPRPPLSPSSPPSLSPPVAHVWRGNKMSEKGN